MRARSALVALALALALLAGGALSLAPLGCAGPPSGGAPGDERDPLVGLRAFEAERHASADFARAPASDKVMGSDPYVVRAIPERGVYASILRGAGALVVLDGELREIARLPAPESPSGLAVQGLGDRAAARKRQNGSGDVYVSSELTPVLARYSWKDGALEPLGEIAVKGARAIRDVAASPRAIYAVDEHDDRLITLLTPGYERVDTPTCAGPFRVAAAGDSVIVDCLIDHELLVLRVDERGIPQRESATRIRHDGPIWGFDAAPALDGDGLYIAAGGVEDRPLDRREGSFGFIDSFVFLYKVAPGSDRPVTKLAEVNVSELQVITPKALKLELGPDAIAARVTGYGGAAQARLAWKWSAATAGAPLLGPPDVEASELPPGTASMAEGAGGAVVLANPLLDAWVLVRGGISKVVPVARPDGAPGDASTRLGEALFFTSLMAPWNSTEGRLSRFTCETCHFEGYVDGRTHHTGRGDVRATTKPLLGLFNNRPHFSRALDPDLSAVAHNEFRVAGAKSGRDPWFSIEPRDFPWLAPMGAAPEGSPAIGPDDLRKALMAFLMSFTHRPNPSVMGRAAFSPLERRGAEVFRDRCEGCHSARLSADEPRSAVPFEAWEAHIMAREGALVWGQSAYKKTGVTPYVHDRGARVPSLRRLFKKRPYFTNGSAKTLAHVLAMARFGPGEGNFVHQSAGGDAQDPERGVGQALDQEAREALLAFLSLL